MTLIDLKLTPHTLIYLYFSNISRICTKLAFLKPFYIAMREIKLVRESLLHFSYCNIPRISAVRTFLHGISHVFFSLYVHTFFAYNLKLISDCYGNTVTRPSSTHGNQKQTQLQFMIISQNICEYQQRTNVRNRKINFNCQHKITNRKKYKNQKKKRERRRTRNETKRTQKRIAKS